MLKITQKLQAIVRVRVVKTGKKYTRSRYYAKIVTTGRVKGEKSVQYFLREGRGWREVGEEEFKTATSKEAVRKIEEQLGRELRQRVEEEMKKVK